MLPMGKKAVLYNSQEGYDLAAKNYDKKKAYLDSFEKGIVLEMVSDVSQLNVLDVGAGTGRLAVELAKKGAQVTALDISEKMLKNLKSKIIKSKI